MANNQEAAYEAQKEVARINAGARLAEVAANNDAMADRANIVAGSVRGSGTLTKYRPTTGWQTPGPGYGGGGGSSSGGSPGSNLVQVAGDLGEPTSYRGGIRAVAPPIAPGGLSTDAGGYDPSLPSFSNPIPVIRGMRQTYTGPSGGTEEYGNLQQANQAFNREARNQFLAANPTNPNLTYPPGTSPEERANAKYGTYQAPGTNLLQAKIEGQKQVEAAKPQNLLYENQKNALKQDQAAKQTQQNLATWGTNFKSEHGIYNPQTKQFELPADEGMARINQKANALLQQGKSLDEVNKTIEPDIYRYYYTPKNIQEALNLYQQRTGTVLPEQTQAALQSGSPEAMATLYPWIQESIRQPKPGFLGSLFPTNKVPTSPGANLSEVVGP